MIATLIRWSVSNRFLVMLATLFAVAWGVWAVKTTAIDALPDLSDVQVIIRTTYPGQAPQIVENQVTYPLATTMLSVPGAKTVRGFLVFRRQLRVCAVRGWHRSVLGALARTGIPEPGAGAPARQRQARRSVRTRPASAGSTSMR